MALKNGGGVSRPDYQERETREDPHPGTVKPPGMVHPRVSDFVQAGPGSQWRGHSAASSYPILAQEEEIALRVLRGRVWSC